MGNWTRIAAFSNHLPKIIPVDKETRKDDSDDVTWDEEEAVD
jgi:hypothetical protein